MRAHIAQNIVSSELQLPLQASQPLFIELSQLQSALVHQQAGNIVFIKASTASHLRRALVELALICVPKIRSMEQD